ncbi:MAG: 4Fe-4S dicluster domain-containing protein [Tenericutes bacterium]|nr:4Fe-4S dicluster domain-containing protein [Mycoplasmatota bacterium]
MRKFDTKVQEMKYRVLKEVSKEAWNGTLYDNIIDIPKKIISGKKPTVRCCIYKEQVIVNERVKLAIGGDKSNPNVIQVIDIACDECPVGGYEVTNACRGCLAHRCETVCPKDAIRFDQHQRAYIDKDKCIECGLCAKACPYSAIRHNRRPCEMSCQVGAISMGKDNQAVIDNEKCVSCGACVYMCPFGAIMDKSYIIDVIDMIKKSEENKNYKVYAIVAPSIASQFTYAKLGQVVKGIKELGFHSVVEVALGADKVADLETKELVKKGFLTSSCCPAFVDYINKHYPEFNKDISHNLSPAALLGQYIKSTDEFAKVVFIGPCTAKKMEMQRADAVGTMDTVITFEELQALFDSRDINLNELEEEPLDNASYFGRIFARGGGLTDAVKQAIIENEIEDFDFRPVVCDGLDEIKMALLKLSKNIDIGNFIEGMACKGGCINGAGCIVHGNRNKVQIDKYGKEAMEKTIKEAISVLG